MDPFYWINLAIVLLIGLVLATGFRSLPASPRKKRLQRWMLVLAALLLASTLAQHWTLPHHDGTRPAPVAGG